MAHGQWTATRSRRRRPPRTSGLVAGKGRSHFVSQWLAGAVRASICSQAELDTLAEMTHESSQMIQVLPFTVSDHPGTDGPILVYNFDGVSAVAYTECKGGGRIVESADEVGDLMMIVNTIRAALSACSACAE